MPQRIARLPPPRQRDFSALACWWRSAGSNPLRPSVLFLATWFWVRARWGWPSLPAHLRPRALLAARALSRVSLPFPLCCSSVLIFRRILSSGLFRISQFHFPEIQFFRNFGFPGNRRGWPAPLRNRTRVYLCGFALLYGFLRFISPSFHNRRTDQFSGSSLTDLTIIPTFFLPAKSKL